MACPFIEDSIEIGGQIARSALRRERIFQDRSDPLHHHDDLGYLYERYRFSRPGLVLHTHARSWGRMLAVRPAGVQPSAYRRLYVCPCNIIHYYYTVGDAERLGKNPVCRAVHQVSSALTQLVNEFIVFPGHLPVQRIKKGFYAIAGESITEDFCEISYSLHYENQAVKNTFWASSYCFSKLF